MNQADTFSVIPNSIMRLRDVPATAKLLIARLRQYQGENSTAWPGVGTLAEELGTDRGSIISNVRKLEAAGLLRVDRRTGYRASNRYRVIIPTGSENPPVEKTHQLENPTSLVGKPDFTSGENLPQENKKTSRKRTNTPVVAIPDSLNVPAFLEAWSLWQEHLREKRKKPTPLSTRMLFRELADMGPDRAVAAINRSITKGWASINEPTGTRAGNQQSGRIEAAKGKYANVGTTL